MTCQPLLLDAGRRSPFYETGRELPPQQHKLEPEQFIKPAAFPSAVLQAALSFQLPGDLVYYPEPQAPPDRPGAVLCAAFVGQSRFSYACLGP